MKPESESWPRYFLGVVVWFMCYQASWIIQVSAAGLALSLADPAVEHDSLSEVLGTAVFLLAGVGVGWAVSLLTRRLRLDEPVWWAPSLSAAGVVTALTMVRLSGGDSGPFRLLSSILINLAPMFIGHCIGVWRQSALSRQPASI